MLQVSRNSFLALLCLGTIVLGSADGQAQIVPQSRPASISASSTTYADLADLADSAPIVLRAQVRKLVPVEAARARGLRPGWGRFYVEARTGALLAGNTALGEALRYLVDVPLDARGKAPALKKKQVLLFARTVPGRAGELQLVASDAQLIWDAATETKLRAILAELVAPGAPGAITGVREAIHVPGALAGEGETQIFLDTADHAAASITVLQRPGVKPVWGVSFSEVLAKVGQPPARETLAWYRLACFLPNSLPAAANLSDTAGSRAQAQGDYRTVLGDLGACPRTRS